MTSDTGDALGSSVHKDAALGMDSLGVAPSDELGDYSFETA